jgi:nucleoside-diphosphate-sugar epimerase
MWKIALSPLVSKQMDLTFEKIIFLSSVDALGIFQGEGIPKYLPLDDDYPCHPRAVYSISKKLAEDMCRFLVNQLEFL